ELSMILLVHLGDGHIPLIAEAILDGPNHLPLVLQAARLANEQAHSEGTDDHCSAALASRSIPGTFTAGGSEPVPPTRPLHSRPRSAANPRSRASPEPFVEPSTGRAWADPRRGGGK